MTMRSLGWPCLCVTGLIMGSAAVHAEEASLADALALDPPQWEIGNTEIQLGGLAAGALFTASQEGGPAHGDFDHTGASGLLTGNIRLRKILDNGMVLGARSDVLIYHDALSGDNYDNDTIEKLYLFAQTGFGRVEIGQQDGAAYQIGLTGPIVDREVSLENRNISLFRDPTTGDDFANFFESAINVYSTSNYAKINYVSPRLFGIQAGLSFTPNTVRSPLPFTGNPSDDPNQQQAIWEMALGYTGYFSNVAVGLSGAFAHGSVKNRTPGFADLYDWSLGTQIAYTMDDVKLSAGGGYRVTNSYLLDIEEALAHGETRMLHLSAMAERGSWLLGVEYSNAGIEGPVGYRILGYQITAGYKLNTNLQLSAGWQWYDYRRSVGTFYNGLPTISLNAGFLSLGYSL
jgi:outer membrane protein OmpU